MYLTSCYTKIQYYTLTILNKMVEAKENTQLLTDKEVVKRLQISRKTLYTLRKNGKIAGLLVGRQLRFTESEVARFINESKETQTEKV